jgi:hypothetical protein
MAVSAVEPPHETPQYADGRVTSVVVEAVTGGAAPVGPVVPDAPLKRVLFTERREPPRLQPPFL